MELSILENGGEASVTEEALWSGKMAQSTRVNGKMVRPVVVESFIIQMETFMRDPGQTIKQMVMGYTSMSKELGTKVNGRMISSTEKESKCGMKALNMMANIQ